MERRVSGETFEEYLEDDSAVLVNSLVASDEAIVPTLRSVLERGWEDRFAASLDHYVSNKDSELRNLCNFHFAEFSDGVQDIAKLKSQSESLRINLTNLDAALQEKGTATVKNSETLLRFHRVNRHLKVAQVELRRVLNLINLVRKTREQVDAKCFFEALQTIDIVKEVVQGEDIRRLWQDRDQTQLPNLDSQDTSRFFSVLERWIPQIIEKIKVDVNDRLTDWFVRARNRAGDVGAKAIQLVGQRQNQALSGFTKQLEQQQQQQQQQGSTEGSTPGGEKRMVRKSSLQRMRSRSSSDAVLAWEHREPTHTVDIAEACLRDVLSLTPVLQYLDIQAYLGEREKAVDFYKKNRVPQPFLLTMCSVDPKKLRPGHAARQLQAVLERVTGFFIIEQSLTRSANLLSPYELASLWNAILDDIVSPLREQIKVGLQSDAKVTLELVQMIIHLSQLLGRNENAGSSSASDAALAANATSGASTRRSGSYSFFRPSGTFLSRKDSTAENGNDTTAGLSLQSDSFAAVNIHSNKMLDTSRLLDICVSERASIAEVLISFGWAQVNKFMNEEKCIPLTIQAPSSEDPFLDFVTRFGFVGLVFEDEQVANDAAAQSSKWTTASTVETFPLRFKFSDTVPKVCLGVMDIMERTFSLARQLGGYLPVEDPSVPSRERLTKSQSGLASGFSSSFVASASCAGQIANICLDRLNNSLEQVIVAEGTPAEILCQYAVNLWYLFKAVESLERFLRSLGNISEEEMQETQEKPKAGKGEKSSSSSSSSNKAIWWKLPVGEKFRRTSEIAQSRVMDAVQGKVDLLMSGCDMLNWTPEELVEAPHEFIADTVQYLTITFGKDSSIQLLPWSKIQATHFTTFAKINLIFRELLCGDRIRKMNALSVYRLKLDVELLISFTKESGIPDLAEYFNWLEQLVAIFVGDDLASFLDKTARAVKYGDVGTDMVVSMLQKYSQLSGSSRLFASSANKFKIIKDSDIKRALQALR